MKSLYNVRTLVEKNLTITETFMFEKNIKKQVNKQLKRNFPKWRKLRKKKEKKVLARQILEAVAADYDFSQPLETDDKSVFGAYIVTAQRSSVKRRCTRNTNYNM